MILGIGYDLVEISRIERLYDRFGAQFLKRWFSEAEIERVDCFASKARKISYLAKRFAGKEAVAKALGTGIRDGLHFRDISIENKDNGQPVVIIKTPDKAKTITIHISLSDERHYAAAFVVIETV